MPLSFTILSFKGAFEALFFYFAKRFSFLPSLLLFLSFLTPDHYLPYKTFYQQLFSVAFLFSLFVIYTEEDRHVAGSKFYAAICVGCVCISLAHLFVGLVQYFRVMDFGTFVHFSGTGRVVGNLAQANHFASIAGFSVSASIYYFFKEKVAVPIAVTAVFLISIPIGLAQSRATLVVVSVVLIALALARNSVDRRISMMILVSQGTIVLFWFAQPYLSSALLLDSTLDRAQQLSQTNVRQSLYKAIVTLIADSPKEFLFGGSNLAEILFYDASHDMTTKFHVDAHNIILNSVVRVGILPTLVGLGLTLLVGKKIYKGRRNIAPEKLLSIVIGLGFLLIHGFFNTTLSFLYCIIPLGLMILILSLETTTASVSHISSKSVNLLRMAGIIGMIYCGHLLFVYQDLRQAYSQTSARFSGMSFTSSSIKVPDNRVFQDALSRMNFESTDGNEALSPSQLDALVKVVARHSLPEYLNHMASIYASHNQCENAELMESKYKRFWPDRAEGRLIRKTVENCANTNRAQLQR